MGYPWVTPRFKNRALVTHSHSRTSSLFHSNINANTSATQHTESASQDPMCRLRTWNNVEYRHNAEYR